MNTAASHRFAAAWIPAAALTFCLGFAQTAWAEPPVLIWGIQQGCDRLENAAHALERELNAQGLNVTLLKSPTGQTLPACTGERCAQALRAACPNAKGRILGGQGIEGQIVRTRLWLYDLDTGQIAHKDDYCHTCSLGSVLGVHARALLDHPNFGSPPGPTPLYCTTPAPAHNAAAFPKGPVFLSVYGDGKHKPALAAALRSQMEALDRTVLPVPGEARSHSTEELEQIVAGQQNAKVLSAQVQKEGTVVVSLYDQNARVGDAENVNCPNCGAEALVLKVKDVVSDLLGRCAGGQCAELVRSGAVEAPVSACEPFSTDTCPSPELDASISPSNPSAVSGGGLNPKTARLIKGLVWGGFAI